MIGPPYAIDTPPIRFGYRIPGIENGLNTATNRPCADQNIAKGSHPDGPGGAGVIRSARSRQTLRPVERASVRGIKRLQKSDGAGTPIQCGPALTVH